VEVPSIQPAEVVGASPGGTPLTLAENERERIRRVLELSGGTIDGPRGAARMLGLKASTLRSRMEKLGLL
jgi:formate hydrogenlyase transcriptional activator